MTNKEQEMGFRETGDNSVYLDSNAFALYVHKTYKVIYADNGKYYLYHHGVYKPISEERLKAIMAKMILRTSYPNSFNKRAEEYYFTALKRIAFYGGGFNKCENLICLKNGMYDVKNKKLIPHSPEYYCTVQLPIKYNKKAKCPQFIKFLKSIFDDDREIMKVIQEMMGYIMTKDNSAQCFFLFFGTGANGKSVLCNLIMALVGEDNCSTVAIRDFSKRFNKSVLLDKLVNISTENESYSGQVIDTQYIKAITGGDAISAEFKGKDVFSFKPFCKLIFSTNTLPQFKDISDGFFRRIIIVPFEKQFSIKDGTADINLEEKLKKELPGIFNLAIKGFYRLHSKDYRFTESKKITKLRNQYITMSNPFEAFWDECIFFKVSEDKSIWETKSAVYQAFINWCKANNHIKYAHISTNKFWMDFNQIFMKKTGQDMVITKSNGNRRVMSISLKKYRPLSCTSYCKLNLSHKDDSDDLIVN